MEISEVLTAGASITGSFQAVVSNNTTSSFINGWTPIFTGPTVQLGVGRSTTDLRPGLSWPEDRLRRNRGAAGLVTGKRLRA
ncbi:MAG: hypothetical protein ACR2HR_03850 [Euzebya sp.]